MSRHSSIRIQKAYWQMGVACLITAGMWLLLSVYQAVIGPAETAIDQDILTPFNPTIDADTLAEVASRTQLSEQAASLAKELPTPTPSAEPGRIFEITEATGSAETQ